MLYAKVSARNQHVKICKGHATTNYAPDPGLCLTLLSTMYHGLSLELMPGRIRSQLFSEAWGLSTCCPVEWYSNLFWTIVSARLHESVDEPSPSPRNMMLVHTTDPSSSCVGSASIGAPFECHRLETGKLGCVHAATTMRVYARVVGLGRCARRATKTAPHIPKAG